MVFWGCSDAVESRVEHPILDAESRRNAALLRIVNSPRALVLRARTSDNDPPRRVGLSVGEFCDLSIDRDQHNKSETGRTWATGGKQNED
jgi:hypothetical protein